MSARFYASLQLISHVWQCCTCHAQKGTFAFEVDQQLQQCSSQQARAHHAANFSTLWEAAKIDYKTTFCKATPDELHDVCSTARIGSGLDGLRNLVIKLQAMYALHDISALPLEEVSVRRLLKLMQDDACQAGTAAKVTAGLNALPAPGAYTFANVAAQLENMAAENDADSAAFMLRFNNRVGGSSVSQAPSPTLLPDRLPAHANLGHLTELQRCKVLAITDPDGLCTVHDKMHTWGECPLATNQSQGNNKSRPPVSHRPAVHATIMSPECEQQSLMSDSSASLNLIKDFMAKVESRVSSQQSAIDSLCETVNMAMQLGERPQHSGYQPRRPFNNYAPRPGGSGYADSSGYRAASGYDRLPACPCCQGQHYANQCWVLRPDLCGNPPALAAFAEHLPPHLKALMQHNCTVHNIVIPSVPPPPPPLGADAYPPRPAAAADARNHVYVAQSSSDDGSAITFADVCQADVVVPSCGDIGVAGMATLSSSSVDVSDCNDAMVCSCGQPCDLIVSSSHESFGEPLWSCSKQKSAQCACVKIVSKWLSVHC